MRSGIRYAAGTSVRAALARLPSRYLAGAVERRLLGLTEYDNYREPVFALESDIPQTMCFLLDAMPTLQELFARYPRFSDVHFLDVGPGYGSAGGLISEMFRGHQLGPKVTVDAIDIHDHRREFIALKYPRVSFLHGDLMALPQSHAWDVLYCSNVIEHTHDPRAFIRKAMQHVRGYGVFLAPYREEEPRSAEHHSVIDDDTFSEFNVDRKLIYESLGWPATETGKRFQILTVLKP